MNAEGVPLVADDEPAYRITERQVAELIARVRVEAAAETQARLVDEIVVTLRKAAAFARERGQTEAGGVTDGIADIIVQRWGIPD